MNSYLELTNQSLTEAIKTALFNSIEDEYGVKSLEGYYEYISQNGENFHSLDKVDSMLDW